MVGSVTADSMEEDIDQALHMRMDNRGLTINQRTNLISMPHAREEIFRTIMLAPIGFLLGT